MRPALLILLAALAMTSASAFTLASTPTPAPLQGAPKAALPSLEQQDDPGHINASAPPHAAALQTVALAPAAAQASPAPENKDTGWQAFAPVTITLALIGAIALRRHQAGKS